MDEIVKGPLPPFKGGIVHGDLAILIEDVPRFDFDGDDAVLEEGEGEVEPVECGVSLFCAETGWNAARGTE